MSHIDQIHSLAERMARRCRVLIVEDNLEFRHVLAYMLGHHLGVECIETGSGCDALHVYEAAMVAHGGAGRTIHPFDIVFMDQRLPDIDGLEVVRRMRTKWPAQPVIICTGFDILIDRAYGCGIFGVLFKDATDTPEVMMRHLRNVFSALNLPVKEANGI